MQYLEKYLENIVDRGNPKLAESISKTAEDIGKKYLKNFSFISHEIGLLMGNVQSGKTGQMFGIMCKAADLGFPVFILLTTDNVVLQQQTLDRVKSDLNDFCICGENDSRIFVDNNLIKPTVIVLKKNARVLRQWSNVLKSTGFMKGNPLFIVDDEADAASLNTLVNKDQKSSINKYLDTIRSDALSSLYLQVTGTPQALFLQTLKSGWRPYFTYYFQAGDAYLGGDFFFPSPGKAGKPKCVTYLDTLKNPVREVVLQHIAVSAHILASGGKVSNCLVHPSFRVTEHEKYANKIESCLAWYRENIDSEFESDLRVKYSELNPEKYQKVSFYAFLSKAREILEKGVKNIVMNGKSEVKNTDYSEGCNFIIGGNTLGRGVTFPGLQTIYYTRTSKKPQADTMWQHSRMFGYDRDPGLMKVYIDENLYKLFSDINATNNSIIMQVKNGVEDIKVYYPEELNPTRKNVLDNEHIGVISGGTNYYPFYPDNDSIEGISKLLARFPSSEPYHQVSLRLMQEILSHIIASPDFKMNAFQSILDAILAETPTVQGILIVRRERNIAQGTGALLSPDDWKLSGSFSDKAVLTMYQVTGTKGWGGKPLWIPNIKLPEGAVYYAVFEGEK
ncbi:Z1 domain-containing protein [Rothia dentocariosa]|uniref:Z1 domain-containing protein n=1 Tax=Rothia dentocariosa TaxID=2047 RepID=UPI00244D4055|nr:Z1 domain-containing protein [Rothia dentocariosa]